MDVRELRIGNWVEHTRITLVGAKVYKFQVKISDFTHAKSYDPILLTPTILEQCGFKKIISFYKEISKSTNLEIGFNDADKYYCVLRQQNRTESMPNLVDDVIIFNNSLKYVHQLQNLYWCLCGKELNIQL